MSSDKHSDRKDPWKPNKADAGGRHGDAKIPYAGGYTADMELTQSLQTLQRTLKSTQGTGSDGDAKVTDQEKKKYLEDKLRHALSVEEFDVTVLGTENQRLMIETLKAFKDLKIDEKDAVLGDELKYLQKAITRDKGNGRG